MAEAALLGLDLLLVGYVCWVALRAARNPKVRSANLGLFGYRREDEA